MNDEAYTQSMYGGSHPNRQFELDCRIGHSLWPASFGSTAQARRLISEFCRLKALFRPYIRESADLSSVSRVSPSAGESAVPTLADRCVTGCSAAASPMSSPLRLKCKCRRLARLAAARRQDPLHGHCLSLIHISSPRD